MMLRWGQGDIPDENILCHGYDTPLGQARGTLAEVHQFPCWFHTSTCVIHMVQYNTPQHTPTFAMEGKALSSSPSRYTTIRISNLCPIILCPLPSSGHTVAVSRKSHTCVQHVARLTWISWPCTHADRE